MEKNAGRLQEQLLELVPGSASSRSQSSRQQAAHVQHMKGWKEEAQGKAAGLDPNPI